MRFTPRKHPHARGEDDIKAPPSSPETETPPRTWGRLFAPHGPGDRDRNTPTHVGKTNVKLKAVQTAKKHPHARGEDLSLVDPLIWWPETPPRTWGRHDIYEEGKPFDRNTPTHVGKTPERGARISVP